MKKKGFTLIELLAVIVILAIIALIAVPIVLNIINNAAKSAFRNTAYGIIKAGELYYADRLLETEAIIEDIVFTFPEAEGLEFDGKRPSSGTMTVTKDGDISLSISDGKYCAKKSFDETEITVTDGTCTIYRTYQIGEEVTFDPGDGENTKWYVIDDNGSELTLILNKNLGDPIEWINEEDYKEANKDDNTTCESGICNDEGPLTAVEYLESLTSGWDNVPLMTYTLKNYKSFDQQVAGQEIYTYPSITRTNVKARMFSQSDFVNFVFQQLGEKIPELSEENLRAYVIRNLDAINSLASDMLQEEVYFENIEDIFEYIDIPYDHYNLISAVFMCIDSGIEPDYFDIDAEGDRFEEELYTIVMGLDWLAQNLDSDSTTDVPKGYWLSDTSPSEENKAYYAGTSGVGMETEANDTEIGVRPVIIVPKDKIEGSIMEMPTGNVLYNVATTSTDLGVTNVNNCALSGTCAPGTEFAIKVNNKDTYKFYVIKDHGDKVDLIMDSNIGSATPWISESDYTSSNTDKTICSTDSCADEGPITALNYLEDLTSDWTNITERSYILKNDEPTVENERYLINRVGARARLLTYTEATNLGCGLVTADSCPTWLVTNLDSDDNTNILGGYWLSSTQNSLNAHGIAVGRAIGFSANDNDDTLGIRPVITLPKGNIENYVEIEKLILSQDSVELDINETSKVKVTYEPSNSTNNDLIWESKDETIATVDEEGTIKGVFGGTTEIVVRAKYSKNVKKTIKVTVKNPYTNGIISSTSSCINTGTCAVGTRVTVQVNNSEDYNFYVISDTGSKLTLLMDKLLGDNVEWIKASDYSKTNTDGTTCDYDACTDEGPVTALNYLESQTKDWSNITSYNYTLTNDADDFITYTTSRTGVKARMLTYIEAKSLRDENGGTFPTWMITSTTDNITNEGYWLTGASTYATTYYISNVSSSSNSFYTKFVYQTSYGIRPVIEVTK